MAKWKTRRKRQLIKRMLGMAPGALIAAHAGVAVAQTTINASGPADVVTAINDANAGQTVYLLIPSGTSIDLSSTTLPTYTGTGGPLNIAQSGYGTYGFTGGLTGGNLTLNGTNPLSVYVGEPSALGQSTNFGVNVTGTGELAFKSASTSAEGTSLFNIAPTVTISGTVGPSIVQASTSYIPQIIVTSATTLPTSWAGVPVLAAGFPITQAFINNYASSSGLTVLALAANSSGFNTSLSLTSSNVSLGAVGGSYTLSGTGTLAPAGSFLWLGGGDGQLTIGLNIPTAGFVIQGAAISALPGFTILSGTNTYSGPTEVYGGVLEFASAAALPSGSALRVVSSNGVGVFAFGYAFGQSELNRVTYFGQTNTAYYGGVIALAAADSNNLSFASVPFISLGAIGSQTYSGTITPYGSTYLLGGGDGALTVTAALTGGNSLAVNQWDYAIGKSYGGQSNLFGFGDGTPVPSVILTNNETYSGATNVVIGRLQLGNGSTAGNLTGTSGVSSLQISGSTQGLNSAILAFNEPSATTFTPPISGAMAVEQDGPGTVTLNGAESYTGITYVASGTLALGTNYSTTTINNGVGTNAFLIGATGTLDISSGGNHQVPVLAGLPGAQVTLGGNTLTLQGGSSNLDYNLFGGQVPLASGLPSNDFRGVISGTGGLVLNNNASQTLGGMNTYQGGTSLNGGGITLGDGTYVGTAGTGAINGTSNGGEVNFNEPSTTTIANALTGTLGVQQLGSKVILTGANSYTGTTSIGNFNTPATLQLGDGTASSNLGTGTVNLGGQLILAEGSNTTLSNTIVDYNTTNTGSVLVNGPGTVTLNGVNTYSGLTEIAGGGLVVGDSSHTNAQVAGNVLIDSAGSLSGYGTIGGNVTNDGTFSPNNLHIGGSFTQGSSADLLISVTPSTISRIYIGSTANLGGTVTFAYAPGTYTANTYTFLSASSVIGTFATVAASVPLPVPTGFSQNVTYGATTANLVLSATPSPPPPSPPSPPSPPTPPTPPTPPAPPPTPPTPPTPPSPPPAPSPTPTPPPSATVAPIDGTVYSAVAFAFAQSNQQSVSRLLGRARPDGGGNTFYNTDQVDGPHNRAWMEATSSGIGGAAITGADPTLHSSINGVQVGADHDIGGGGRLGFAVGYNNITYSDSLSGKANVNSVNVSVYGSQTVGDFGISGVLSYANGTDTINRATGVGSTTAHPSLDEFIAAGQVTRPFQTPMATITPAIGLQVGALHIGSFNESLPTAPAFAVHGSGGNQTAVSPFATVAASHEYFTSGGVSIIPEAVVGYQYNGQAIGSNVNLTAADGTVFNGNRISRPANGAIVGLGLTAHQGLWTAYARADSVITGNWTQIDGIVGARLAF